jgi:hypothetical protein
MVENLGGLKFSQSPILAPKWVSNNAFGQVQKLLIWCFYTHNNIFKDQRGSPRKTFWKSTHDLLARQASLHLHLELDKRWKVIIFCMFYI